MSNTIYQTTYPLLVAELSRVVEDADEEFTSDIDNIIGRAQDRVCLDLDLTIFHDLTSASLVDGTATLNRPTNSITIRWIRMTTSNRFLERRALDFCKLYGGSNLPKYFADYSESQLYLAPTPDDNYAYEISFLRRPTLLSATDPINWLTENVPSLLLAACLIEGEAYLVGDERLPIWKEEYVTKLALAKEQFHGMGRYDKVERGAAVVQPEAPAA